MRDQPYQGSATLPAMPHVDGFERVVQAWKAVSRFLLSSWRGPFQRHSDEQEFSALAEMSEHMLKDIGAPAPLISRASERCSAEHRRLADFNRGYESLS
jgi:uncharacterized protein YjiS (DUF1127 family)